ncbi:MAG: endonuclease MutS2 [Halanaerobiaceae bacterium]
MDKNSLEALELDKIISRVKNLAATDIGREIIDKLNPIADLEYVQARLREVTVGREIVREYGFPGFGGIKDIREIIKKVEREMSLTAEEIIAVRDTVYGFGELRNFFNHVVEDADPELVTSSYSLLTERALEIKALTPLKKEINRCIDDYGEIRDTASPRLNSLRRRMKDLEDKIRQELEGIVRSSRYQSMLQDTLVTRRENRYVVPVKKEYRNTFSGIVHDHSASGMTVYMEPMAVVELNNTLREVKSEEEAEIERILQQLSYKISGRSEEIISGLRICSLLDVVFARVKYSREIDGTAPALNDSGIIEIRGGRHPLLPEDPVPIDIEAGDDFTSLVITGPNTGGKTVSLKTVGLFVLMAECGLHLPADRGTNIAVFENVFADIGDEQSIEQNLSTFSSHMNNIRRFLRQADSNSLVLLDELGAGTDPREGAALGISILEELKAGGVTTVATTHYSQLKSYAYNTSGVENASVEFDIETLKPTYRLIMGIPGGSNAFQIALRLGLPEKIISRAEEYISEGELQVEDIISRINQDRRRYEELKLEMERKNSQVEKMKTEYEKRLHKLEKKEEEIIREARREAKQLVRQARERTKKMVRELKKKDFTQRPEIDRKATEITEEVKELENELSPDTEDKNESKKVDYQPGDRVRIRSVGQKGEILEVDEENNQLVIQAGVMQVTADMSDIVPAAVPDKEKEEMVKNYRLQKSQHVSPTLDLRGNRYEEAQRNLDKYLDDVFLAGIKEVEIIHGKGSGALRKAVREVLDDHPHVPSYREGKPVEGGSGVTIVSIS